MLIQVINLEKDKDRLNWMTQSLSERGLGFQRVDAVRVDSLQGHEDRYASLFNHGLYPEEVCCSLSHLQAWINLVKSVDEFGLILEDDVHLSEDFTSVINSTPALCEQFGDRPLVVKLETFFATVTAGLKKHELNHQRFASELLSNHAGSAGYVLNRATAEYLIQVFSKFSQAIDFELFHPDLRASQDLIVYQVFPACVIQDQLKPNPVFMGNIPNRLSVSKKHRKVYLTLKSLVKPLHLIACNLYLFPNQQCRLRVNYR